MSRSADSMNRAVEILRRGGVVAFPTETVYGLGADATQARAVRAIFRIKGRPATNPLIAHVADLETARRFAARWPESAQRLATRFWPGPLTLVLPKHPSIVDEATAGLPTVGLRVPDHPVALELLRRFGGAIAAPSANLSNRISPTSAQHVQLQLGQAVDLILDGGPCRVGIESTVLDLSGDRPRILRPGGVSRRQIEAEIGPVEAAHPVTSPGQPARSPGQHPVHYAPRAPAYRIERGERQAILSRLGERDRLVAIEPAEASEDSPKIYWLPNDPPVYAERLYALLSALDMLNPDAIYIEMPPDTPEWLAVRDRLFRATRSFGG